MLLTLPWSWSISACIRSCFFLSSSPAKVSSLIVRSDLRRFLQMSPLRLLSASNSDSNSLMRVSILIMALRPPFSALTSASSARAPASLHWASRSFLSFSRFIATSCSQRSSSASLAASTIALAALSSESLASLLSSTSLAICSFQQSTTFLKCILHSCSLAISCYFSISSSRFSCGFLINLELGISDLLLVLLNCVLSLSITSDGMLQCQGKVSSISFKFLFHSEGLCLALCFSFKGSLHGVQCLCLVFPNHSKFLILFSNAAINLNLNLSKLHLAPENFVLLLFQCSLCFFKSRLQFLLFSLKTLSDFVNFMDGSSSFGNLIHDILDFI